MFGTIKFSSRVQYGRNKRNIPYYLFESTDNIDKRIIVASKLKSDRVDHYAEIDILDDSCNPIKGAIKKIIGPINDYNCTKKLIIAKNRINKINQTITIDNFESDERLDQFTFSIDPEGSKDIDDAFSFDFDRKLLKVHITDLTDLQIDNLDELIDIGFTFYDKDGNVNMLPSNISEDECSLIEGKLRRSISMIINLKNNEINFKRCVIKVNKNLSYEKADNLFLNDIKWITFKNIVIEKIGNFNDTHEFIEKLMIMYNSEFSNYLYKENKNYPIRIHEGIKLDVLNKLSTIDEKLKKRICYHAAEYIPLNETLNTIHKSLDIDKYTHASSPLRRLVDLVNQRIAFSNLNLDLTNLCNRINSRNIELKNAYREIKLLDLSVLLKDSEERIYDAIIIGFNENRIKIFIPDLDIISSIKIFNDRVNRVLKIKITDDKIDIEHLQTSNIITLETYQNIKVKTMIKMYESRLYKKIQFFIMEPNLIDLLD